jgi:hypothetical protein
VKRYAKWQDNAKLKNVRSEFPPSLGENDGKFIQPGIPVNICIWEEGYEYKSKHANSQIPSRHPARWVDPVHLLRD